MSFVSPQVFGAIARIVHGWGTVATLPDEVRRLGGQRIMLVSDPGLVRAGLVDRIGGLLSDFDTAVFADVEPDPSLETVGACADQVRRHGADLVIGLGSGLR